LSGFSGLINVRKGNVRGPEETVIRDALLAARAAAGAGRGVLIRRSCTRDPEFDVAMARAEHVPGWFNAVNAAAFRGVMGDIRPRTVVEIGSYLGRSTVLLGLALQHFGPADARLVAIDPHTGDRQQLEALGLTTLPTLDLCRLHIAGNGLADLVDLTVARSDDAAVGWTGDIDLLFVDGWHSYDAVRSDITNWATRLAPGGLACFDDFGTYHEVNQAVRDGCAAAGLTVYGSILAQAWAGWAPTPPPSLARGLRFARRRPRPPAR
jgi:predicted O-methyltransferase YrrM